MKALIFDLGNVLLRFDHGRMTAALGERYGCDASEIEAFLFGDDRRLWHMEDGAFDSRSLHEELNGRFRPIEYDAFFAAGGDIFEDGPEMADLVRRLKAAGYRLVVLSNTSDLHIGYVRQNYATLEPFDALTLSYEVKSSKPAPAIYEHAIAQAGTTAAHCLFIDDRAENVAGAEAVGLRAHLFCDQAGLEAWLRKHGVRV